MKLLSSMILVTAVLGLTACTGGTESTESVKTTEHKAKTEKSDEKETADADTKTEKKRKPASAVANGGSVFVVQLGAFREEDNAKAFTEKMKKDGFDVKMRSLNHSKNGPLFLVSMPPTGDQDEAKKWADDVKSKSDVEAQMIIRK